MYGRRFIWTIIRLWLAAMVLSAVSCNKPIMEDEDFVPSSRPGSQAESEVSVEFRILDPDAAPDTKADNSSNWGEYDNTASEKVINNLYLFVTDYDTETKEETVEEAVKVDLVAGDFTSEGVKVGHTFRLSPGIKHFYVGANMTEEHVNAFKNKTTMRADSYESALEMVMDNYAVKDGSGTNILMFSAPATDEYEPAVSDIDITGKRYIYLKAQLKRLVSKVMVVGEYDGTKTNAQGRAGETINYIRTENGLFFDLQVILNNTNRALNIAETFSDGSPLFNIDPNWNLGDVVMKDGSLIRYKDMFDVAGNFSSWEREQLEERLESASEWWCMDVPSKESSYMGKGLYCLENTVSDDSGLSSNEKIKAAYLATTHVYLKARFVPFIINGDSDNSENTTDERISHLWWNTDQSGVHRYTFYIDKEKGRFFTTTGVKRWVGDNGVNYKKTDGTAWTWDDFEMYTGGWVYFKTFFESGGKATGEGAITYEGIDSWGIRRNDYCVLTIRDVVNWGSVEPGEPYIKVKAETADWVKRGKTEIEIIPE